MDEIIKQAESEYESGDLRTALDLYHSYIEETDHESDLDWRIVKRAIQLSVEDTSKLDITQDESAWAYEMCVVYLRNKPDNEVVVYKAKTLRDLGRIQEASDVLLSIISEEVLPDAIALELYRTLGFGLIEREFLTGHSTRSERQTHHRTIQEQYPNLRKILWHTFGDVWD